MALSLINSTHFCQFMLLGLSLTLKLDGQASCFIARL